MRWPFNPLWFVSLLGALLFVVNSGCQECAPQQSQACTCADGKAGKQLCDSSKGAWAACSCNSSPPPLDGGNTETPVPDRAAPELPGETPTPPTKTLPPPEVCAPACQHQGVCEQKVCVCPKNYTGATCGECQKGYEGYPQCKQIASQEDFPIYIDGQIADLQSHQDALIWLEVQRQKPYALRRKSLLTKDAPKTIYEGSSTWELFLTLTATESAYLFCETFPLDDKQDAVCRSIPLEGGQPTELLRTSNLVYLSATDGKSLYLIQDKEVISAPSDTQLLQVDLQSKTTSETSLKECDSPNILVRKDAMLWATCIGVYTTSVVQERTSVYWKEGALLSMGLDGNKVSPVMQSSQGILGSTVVGNQWFYSTAYWRNANTGGLRVVDIQTKQDRELLSQRGDMILLASDGTSIYWVETHPAPGLNISVNRDSFLPEQPARHYYIRSMPLAGGTVTTHLDSLQAVVGLVLHKGGLYYATYQPEPMLTTIWKHKP